MYYDKIKNINLALTLLNDGDILYINEYTGRIYFKKIDSSILIKNKNYTSKLSEEDFIKLFSSSSFYVLDQEKLNNDTIDLERDKEYYSWKYK
jgi:hypothetical protein